MLALTWMFAAVLLLPHPPVHRLQVLGRNLEGVVNSAMELKKKWSDQFCSVEHLVLALAADTRFGEALFKAEGLTKAKLEEAVKEVTLCSLVLRHS